MDKSQNAIVIFNKYATEYQNKFMDVSLYHHSFDLFCKNISNDAASIIELACGPGNITHYLLEKQPHFKILGTDLSPNMLQLAKENNPKAEFQLMDARAINTITKKQDAIMCGFCLPYLSKEDAVKLIEDAAQLLNANGVLYISTMEDDYSKSGYKKGSAGDEIFMHYHQADYLTEALEKNNFKIVELLRQDFPSNDEKKTTDLIIIAKK